jgi:uncharacterized membrane protein
MQGRESQTTHRRLVARDAEVVRVRWIKQGVSGRVLSPRRAGVCLGAGLVAASLVALLWTPELAPLAGWVVAAGTAVSWVWAVAWHLDSEGTERLAEEESASPSTDAWVVSASVISLGAVVVALVRSTGTGAVAVATVLLSVTSVTIAWGLVNTVFALKYARAYYIDEPNRGGFDFKQDAEPAYSDFAYLAFTVGMSFAVSEIEPTRSDTRKIALGHALLSYLFGTGVVAVAINLVTNLGQS